MHLHVCPDIHDHVNSEMIHLWNSIVFSFICDGGEELLYRVLMGMKLAIFIMKVLMNLFIQFGQIRFTFILN